MVPGVTRFHVHVAMAFRHVTIAVCKHVGGGGGGGGGWLACLCLFVHVRELFKGPESGRLL